MESVVDVRAEGVQRHAALAVELGAGHFSATQTAGHLDTNALGASALRGLDALTHRTTEGHANVQLNLLARQLLELDAQAVGLCTTATDDDARASGVQVDANAVTRALDAHLGDAGALEVVGQELADRDVFGHVIRVALSLGGGVGEPARPVVSGDSQTEPAGVDLLTHISGLPSSCLPWYPPRW
ncbi:Uncharacterised protein [Mycobacteroides abscessus subsp. abscessus]|nr:Uncharacterised protein [Mycobacteroides abscessus subsp. abscessus]